MAMSVDHQSLSKQVEAALADPSVPPSLAVLVRTLRMLITHLIAQNEQPLRAQYGRRSERVKVPGAEKTAPQQSEKPAPRKPKTPLDAHDLPTETIEHAVPAEARRCTVCGGTDFVPLGAGEVSNELEDLPRRLIQRRHARQRLACRCGACVVMAPAPPRVAPGVVYGPALHAHVVTARCADSIPLSRLADRFKRDGRPIARSTVIELFHRSAETLKPLRAAVMAAVRSSIYVRADETPLPVLAPDKTRRAYMWVFGTDKLTAFLYRPTRSGQAAVDALGNTTGTLQVDGYTGYNAVTTPAGRTRVGCWAHARRTFYEARPSAPEAVDSVLGLIHGLYRIEIDARDQGIAFTDEHATLRRERAPTLLAQLHAAVIQLKQEFPPKSGIATAASYTLKQWTELSRFVDDVRLPLDKAGEHRPPRGRSTARQSRRASGGRPNVTCAASHWVERTRCLSATT